MAVHTCTYHTCPDISNIPGTWHLTTERNNMFLFLNQRATDKLMQNAILSPAKMVCCLDNTTPAAGLMCHSGSVHCRPGSPAYTPCLLLTSLAAAPQPIRLALVMVEVLCSLALCTAIAALQQRGTVVGAFLAPMQSHMQLSTCTMLL